MQSDDEDGQSRSWRGSHLGDWRWSAVVFLIGAVVSLVVFLSMRAHGRDARRADFERRAARLAATAEDSFDAPLEVLRSIPAFFEASDEVTRAEFRTFVGPALERYPWIYALEWIPRVPKDQRGAYQAAAIADGIAGYHFKQDAPNGPPVPAAERDDYYPLYFMEPPNLVALGIEETALPARRDALERARDLGATAISARLRLVQDDPSVAALIAFHPVYAHGERPEDLASRRASLRGLAAAVFRVAPVLSASLLRHQDLATFDLSILDAETAPATVLYESSPGISALQSSRVAFDYAATVAGRRWLFRVGDRAGFVQAGGVGWLALAIGLLLSAFTGALVFAARSALRLRRQVEAARKLGQYTLVEKLGEGGMGIVYRAHHATLRRPTAVKLLDLQRTGPTALARFESEVQLTSSLSHPNTVVVYDYGHNSNGVFYYAMEYIEGITLQTLVEADGPQPAERVVPILVQICSALAEAHGIGLVHRDIKPANIMLCNRGGIPDFVKVLDFGLAKDLSAPMDPRLSQSALLVGTPLYAAPELLLKRGAIDQRVDIYALGAVAYFLVTGNPVFVGGTTVEVCAKHIALSPESPSSRLGGSVPAGLESIIMRCLAKEPDDRPASAELLAAELRRLSLAAWDLARARVWWAERGQAIEAQVRSARGDLAGQLDSNERPFNIDRRRQPSA